MMATQTRNKDIRKETNKENTPEMGKDTGNINKVKD